MPRTKRATPAWLAVAAVLLMPAEGGARKRAREWHAGTVLSARIQHEQPPHNVAGEGMTGGIQQVRERYDIAGEDRVYSVESVVVYNQALDLSAGAPVQYAIEGKSLVLRSGGRERKMRLTGSRRK